MTSTTGERARKIRALLDKAEATEFPAEAEALTVKAMALMAQWQITEAMIAENTPRTGHGEILTVDIELGRGPYLNARLSLLASAGYFQQCRVLTSTGWNGRIGHLVGHEGDVARAEMLYTSLLVQAMSAVRASSGPGANSSLNTTSWRRNFLLGFARTASDRLQEAAQQAAAKADEAASSGTPGSTSTKEQTNARSVSLVLADRQAAVDDWVERTYGKLRSARGAAVTSHAGWTQGRRAARHADLGTSSRVGGNTRALSR